MRSGIAWVPLCAVWLAVAAVLILEERSGPLASAMWLMFPVVELLVGGVAVAVCLVSSALLGHWRRYGALAAALLVALPGLALAVAMREVPGVRPWVRFHVERPAFREVLGLVAEGRLVPDGSYYGARLPEDLCFVSATCTVASLGTHHGEPVLFLPDRTGIPDDAVGYAHFAGEPDGRSYDGFGMRICPVLRLPDGWWWMARPAEPGPDCRTPARPGARVS